MVVKQVASKKGTGSFKGLADYLLDKRNGGKKVYDYEFNNCSFEQDINLNLMEIQNTTSLNAVAKSDRVLHLVVSFHENEHPTKEQLQYIEQELVKAIGMEEHQRLTVSHNNTNNFHIHIAINRIHPESKKIIDPYQSKKKLSEKAFEIEEKFGFNRDQNQLLSNNNENKKTKVSDQEVHTGIKNFSSWIKDEVLESLLNVIKDNKATFEDFQKVLAEANLELKPRGNGIVIAHKSRKLFIKSSAIHRNLSKAQLEKRFGKPLNFKTINIKPKIEFGMIKHDLWERYKEQSNKLRAVKKQLLTEAKQKNLQEKEVIKTKYKLLIKETKKDLFLTSKAKRNIYQSLFNNRKKEYQELSKKYKKERDNIHKQTNQISYKEFLIKKALEGNNIALAILQRTKIKLHPDEKAILGKRDYKIFITKSPYITKQGLIVYNIGEHGKIIDKGDRLRITIDNNELAIKELLEMSIAKYGTNLDISGDITFKQKVLAVTEKYNLKINFRDKTMQEIKKAAQINIKTKNKKGISR